MGCTETGGGLDLACRLQFASSWQRIASESVGSAVEVPRHNPWLYQRLAGNLGNLLYQPSTVITTSHNFSGVQGELFAQLVNLQDPLLDPSRALLVWAGLLVHL